MRISYDPKKNERNLAMGRPSFERVKDLSAPVWEGIQHRNGEERYTVFAYLDGRLCHLVYRKLEDDDGISIRVISFRKANEREAQRHGLSKEVSGYQMGGSD